MSLYYKKIRLKHYVDWNFRCYQTHQIVMEQITTYISHSALEKNNLRALEIIYLMSLYYVAIYIVHFSCICLLVSSLFLSSACVCAASTLDSLHTRYNSVIHMYFISVIPKEGVMLSKRRAHTHTNSMEHETETIFLHLYYFGYNNEREKLEQIVGYVKGKAASWHKLLIKITN